MKRINLGILAVGAFAFATHLQADTLSYSGTSLQNLTYTGNPASDATFVTGSPDYANLYTPNADLGGDTPSVSVNGPLGTLGNFTASYVILSQTGGGIGNSGYWDLMLSDPANPAHTVQLEVIAYSGTTLNGSSQVHTPSGLFAFGTLLSTVDGITDGSTTLGNWIVNSAGVEIGNYDDPGVGAMDLEIASLSVTGSFSTSAPDATSTLPLLACVCAGAFWAARRRLGSGV